jgi:hypothetical protein
MKEAEAFWKEVYPKLGYLFYATAFANNSIEDSEMDVLKKTVRARWLHIEEKEVEFGTDAAVQIISVFDPLAAEQISSAKAYRVFSAFCCKNHERMDAALKEKILQTAVDISLAFNSESKEEHALITSLTAMLRKTEKCAHCRLKEKQSTPPDAVSLSL